MKEKLLSVKKYCEENEFGLFIPRKDKYGDEYTTTLFKFNVSKFINFFIKLFK